MNTIAIILAGGAGTRFSNAEPKQFHAIDGRPLLEICLYGFQVHKGINSIILVCPLEHLARAEQIAASCSKVTRVLAGGKTRQESSAIGVGAVPTGIENVLIHDAARALVPAEVIDRVLRALDTSAAVMPVVPAGDTTVRIDDAGTILAVLDREMLRRVQTPQGFKLDIICKAHEMACQENVKGAPDDCSLVLHYGLAPVTTVEGDVANIKVTYPQDLVVTETILKIRDASRVTYKIRS